MYATALDTLFASVGRDGCGRSWRRRPISRLINGDLLLADLEIDPLCMDRDGASMGWPPWVVRVP